MSPSPSVSRVFVDSLAHFALLDRHDQSHPDAKTIQGRLIRCRARLFTTDFILAETHALLLSRLGQAIATAFLREMEISPTISVSMDCPFSSPINSDA